MAVNPRRRQRKLEKKRAQRKSEKKLIARQQSQGIAAKFRDVGSGRLLHCECTTALWDEGMGQVWIARELRNGLVGFVAILLDVYCLGVKDVTGKVCPRSEYFERYGTFSEQMDREPMSLECARKLVEGAIAFAREAEIQPHPDYQWMSTIFGDADAGSCQKEFQYGVKGKPTFISGPYDSAMKCQAIVEKLERRYGPNGYTSLIIGEGLDPSDFGPAFIDDEDSEMDDDIDEDDDDVIEIDQIRYFPPR